MKPVFFSTAAEFRKWLSKHYNNETELVVGFYKVDSGKASMTWSQSVDEALCFGWIDGIRKSIDKDSYCIRFTPRRPTSTWSAINLGKMKELTKKGLVKPAGLAIFQMRKEHRSRLYSHENEPAKLAIDYERKFKASKKAWNFFTAQAPSYQKVITHWIMTAKLPATRLARLTKAIEESKKLQRLT